MRSFIGAVKVLSRVIPGCSSLLAKLDDTIAGRDSKKTIQWTDDFCAPFRKAQAALSTARTISLPIPSDPLWMVTDGAPRKPVIGATPHVTRNDKLRLAGFFSAKLRGLTINMVTMWGGGPSNRRCHQALQPIPDTVTSQGLHIDRQQTLRTGIWKTLQGRVLVPCSQQAPAYLPFCLL